MSTLVESLKRLYETKRLTKNEIMERVEKGSITTEEFRYITNVEYPVPSISIEK